MEGTGGEAAAGARVLPGVDGGDTGSAAKGGRSSVAGAGGR